MGPSEASDMIKIALLARAEGYKLYGRGREREGGRKRERGREMYANDL